MTRKSQSVHENGCFHGQIDINASAAIKRAQFLAGKDFEQDGINVQVEFNEEQTSVDIKLHKVKFVPAMPVTIDVTIDFCNVKKGERYPTTYTGSLSE